MSLLLLVNARQRHECRVAILEEGVLLDYFYERVSGRPHQVGNIYRAKVVSLERSLQAAFVDIGASRNAFLPRGAVRPPEGAGRRAPLNRLLRKGKTVLVQITREPMAGKGAVVTTYISIPGRFLVLTPYEPGVRVSRKIADEKQRGRLAEIVKSIVPENYGFVVRTAAADRRKADLARDFQYIMRLYKRIEKKAASASAPSLIYSESSLAIRIVRDFLSASTKEILVDDPDVHKQMREFMEAVMPSMVRRLRLYDKPQPLFETHEIEEQVEALSSLRVNLPSGGWITIEQTEGMTAVDVNTGSTRGDDSETVALTTNIEAADALVRQLRLRDIGGLVVVDLIDMRSTNNRKKVERRLRAALRQHKERFTLLPINRFGVLVLSRQRRRETVTAATGVQCPTCAGAGIILSPQYLAARALRKLHSFLAESPRPAVRLVLPPAVAESLFNEYRDVLVESEERFNCAVHTAIDTALSIDHFQILPE